jgi:predicted hotdog family 3-hydroxylacyl-ACP dehydratase
MNNCPYPIEELVAHDAPMILIDKVEAYDDENIRACVEISDQSPFMENGIVPAYVCVEYMAQTIAAYSGIHALNKGGKVHIGFLLGTRKLELMSTGFKVGDKIIIEAHALYNDGEMASFDCIAKLVEKIVAKARLNVYQPNEDNSIKDGQIHG